MKIIVGLGNPGEKYQSTRHNAGFMLLDLVALKLNLKFNFNKKLKSEVATQPKAAHLGGQETNNLILLKPQTFMNESGEAVRALFDFYKLDLTNLENLYVVHDDLDLELGQYKIQLGTGPKIHNGLNSIYQRLGTKNFWHVRIGVDARGGDRSMSGSDYVLQNFSNDERKILQNVTHEVLEKLLS